MAEYDTGTSFNCEVKSGSSKIDNFFPNSNIFKLYQCDNSFPENEESVEINLNDIGEDSLSDSPFLMECSPNFNNEGDANCSSTSSSASETSEPPNVSAHYHRCHVTSPPSIIASPEEVYLEAVQGNNISEATSCACQLRQCEKLSECKSRHQPAKWTPCDERTPRKPRIAAKRTLLQISMTPEKKSWCPSQDALETSKKSSPGTRSSPYHTIRPSDAGYDTFIDNDVSEAYCSSVPSSSPNPSSRYSIGSTNRSCSSCRYLVKRSRSGRSLKEPLLIKVDKCDSSFKVNFELSPPSNGCRKRRSDGEILCRDRGHSETTHEVESSYTDSGFDSLVHSKVGFRSRLKDESKNCFTGASNSECQVITRTKSCTEDLNFCCRPCKGRAGTRLGQGEPCYRQCSCSPTVGCICTSNTWFCTNFTPKVRDNCVQTLSDAEKRHQWVQCVELSCQSTDQCCQTPVSSCSVEFECQPQVKQNPCKGCRPCSSCFTPRNCSAAIPRWRSAIAEKGSPCYDDDAFSMESIYVVPEKKPTNDEESSHCESAVSHCEVDVEVDQEATPVFPDDTDTSTISSSILRLGLAAATSSRYITREILMKK
ncbi:unnamed protein product [Hydatigera taeniaeformis]|uniref:Histone-lysine N-methyltransferase n=1 Tax=Hydatigena taeniaeformis TaxID=6205 RepID=A0A0R3X1Y8_HYDTA|nr:unnamed protein product [Hydatigera taeniaeformis]